LVQVIKWKLTNNCENDVLVLKLFNNTSFLITGDPGNTYFPEIAERPRQVNRKKNNQHRISCTFNRNTTAKIKKGMRI